jgi:hypothetical protein
MAITYALLVNAGFVFTLQSGTSDQPLTGRPASLAQKGPPLAFAAPGSTTHPSAQTMAHWRTVAQCMRQNGVSRFPDHTTSVPPKPAGSYGLIASRDGAILAIPATINRQSAAFIQATTACGFMADYTKLSA